MTPKRTCTWQTKVLFFLIEQWFRFAPAKSRKEGWNVLTALRGPDEGVLPTLAERLDLKMNSTSKIRGALLRYHSCWEGVPAAHGFLGGDFIRREHLPADGHFTHHILEAGEVLGLIWRD